jgi:hypothetical protein
MDGFPALIGGFAKRGNAVGLDKDDGIDSG